MLRRLSAVCIAPGNYVSIATIFKAHAQELQCSLLPIARGKVKTILPRALVLIYWRIPAGFIAACWIGAQKKMHASGFAGRASNGKPQAMAAGQIEHKNVSFG